MPASDTIQSIQTFPLRLERDEAYLGTLPAEAAEQNYFRRPPYRALYSRYFETLLVKVTTKDGVSGWGEALAPVAPEVVAAIIEQLLAPVLIGANPLDGDVLWHRMYDLMRERGYYGGFMLDAISACDIALWDLRGKLLNLPLYRLLGGAYREQVPCYVSGLPKPTDNERVELAQTWWEQGFTAFKLHIGNGVKTDAATMRALRNALGDEAALLLDAHWVYSLDEAVTLGRELETLDAALLEAPINPEDIAAHAQLTRSIAVPVGIGETERTRYQFLPWLQQRAADVLQPDVGRVGISEVLKIAHMAQAFNIPIAPHLSVGLAPSIAASVHIAAAIPNLFMLEYQPPVLELANTLLWSPLVCENGAYALPDAPGLGFDINEDAL